MKQLVSNQAETNTSIQMIRDDTKALSERLDQINGKVEINIKNQCVNFKDLESRMAALPRPTGTFPSNTQHNPRPQFNVQDEGNDDAIVDEEIEMEEDTTVKTPITPPKPVVVAEVKPYKPMIPFPQRLKKTKLKEQYNKFVASFLNAECSAILQNRIPPKLKDPGSFLITCSIRTLTCKALADLGASINLMPYSVYTKMALGVLRPTRMSIRLADHSFQYPIGIAENMTVRVGHIVFLVDFVILEMEEDTKVPLILGRPFLKYRGCDHPCERQGNLFGRGNL
uniref:uncharacterized protein LOC122609205 n=1 Tax=Erigeron canadensis TaxID=72917 RepID=UPI001CB8DC53|nr:uncharacterized protein LOC122609205 [Erigeron canadensis]